MRTIIALGIVVALLSVGSLVGLAQGSASVTYDIDGQNPLGVLFIGDAEGQPFYAIDRMNRTVASGVVQGAAFSLPVSNAGPSAEGWLLRVTVGGEVFYVQDKDWIWE